MEIVLVLPSLPVPAMTMARGAGLSCAENQTRSLASNQRTWGTGRRHGNSARISESGTFAGRDAMSCGGVPNTVARSPAESARPIAGPGAGGACGADCGDCWVWDGVCGGDWGGSADSAPETADAPNTNTNGISLRAALIIRIVVTIAATRRGFDDRSA